MKAAKTEEQEEYLDIEEQFAAIERRIALYGSVAHKSPEFMKTYNLILMRMNFAIKVEQMRKEMLVQDSNSKEEQQF